MRSAQRITRMLAGVVALFVVAIICAPPSFAAPSVDISDYDGLTDGQKITVSGSGFEPDLKQIAVGLCRDGYTGPNDCYLSGATFRNADSSGSIGTFEITVTQKFSGIDCGVEKCVIGIGPLPTVADAATVSANTFDQPVTFGAAADPVEEETEAPAESTTPAATDDKELPKTGASDLLPILVVGAGAFLLLGGALRFGFRRPGGVA